MTLATRTTGAGIAGLRQFGLGAVARARAVTETHTERLYQTAYQNCPVDEGFMRDHLRKEYTPAGLGSQIGFRASDFRAAGKPFYPVYVIWGTRFMLGRDFLFSAAAAERPRYQRDLKDALRFR